MYNPQQIYTYDIWVKILFRFLSQTPDWDKHVQFTPFLGQEQYNWVPLNSWTTEPSYKIQTNYTINLHFNCNGVSESKSTVKIYRVEGVGLPGGFDVYQHPLAPPYSHSYAWTLYNWGLFLFLLAVRCVSLFSWFSKEDSSNSFFQMREWIACVAQEHDDLKNWTNTSNKKKNFRCREIQHAFTHHNDKDAA